MTVQPNAVSHRCHVKVLMPKIQRHVLSIAQNDSARSVRFRFDVEQTCSAGGSFPPMTSCLGRSCPSSPSTQCFVSLGKHVRYLSLVFPTRSISGTHGHLACCINVSNSEATRGSAPCSVSCSRWSSRASAGADDGLSKPLLTVEKATSGC